MKDASGEELIATAGAVAAMLAKTMEDDEIIAFCELLGLVRHNLDIIRIRRFIAKKHDVKKDDKK